MVNGWKTKKLGEVAEVCMCKRIFAHQTSKIGNIPFYKIGTFGKEADAYISSQLYEEYKSKYSYPEKGDVLISAAGTLGRTVVFDGRPAYFQDSNIVWLKIDKSQLCNDYLAHYYKVIKWASSEGSTISRLYNGIICDTEILLPPLEEQAAIAEALSDVDSLISSLQKLIEKKKAIKQGNMQELLTGKKRLLGFSGEWETRKVGELCSIVTKQTGFDYTSTIKPNLIEHPQSNALPMIQTKNFVGRKFNFSTDYYIPTDIAKEFDKIVLDTVCLLFSIVGASVGNIGLFPGDKVAFCGGAIGIAKFYHEIDAIYAFYYFLSESGQQQIRNVTKGGAQATVTIEDIREFTIPYPNLKERALIAQTLSDMDSEIEQQEKKLAKYQQIKQGMMQELLTGRIRLV